MGKSSAGVYLALLAHETGLSHTVQEHIFDFAKVNSNYELLSVLGSYEALAPSIATKLSKVPNVKVQATLLMRPERTAEELSALARKDKRVALAQALAGMGTLDESAYAALARNDSPGVALTLAANEKVPMAYRSQATAQIVRAMPTLSAPNWARFDALATSTPEIAESVLTHTLTLRQEKQSQFSSATLRVLRLYLAVRADALDELSAKAIASLEEILLIELADLVERYNTAAANMDKTSSYYYSSSAHHREQNLIQLLIYLQTLLGTPFTDQSFRDAAGDIVLAITPAKSRSAHLERLQETLIDTLVVPYNPDEYQTPRSIARINNPEILLGLAQNLDTSAPTSRALANAMLAHPLADKTLAQVLVDKGLRNLNVKAAVVAHREDPVFAGILLGAMPHAVSDETLALVEDPEVLLIELCKIAPTRFVRELANSKFVSAKVIREIPLSAVRDMDSPEMVGSKMLGLISSELVRALGEDPGAWSLFDDIAQDAPDPLGLLLEKISALGRALG